MGTKNIVFEEFPITALLNLYEYQFFVPHTIVQTVCHLGDRSFDCSK